MSIKQQPWLLRRHAKVTIYKKWQPFWENEQNYDSHFRKKMMLLHLKIPTAGTGDITLKYLTFMSYITKLHLWWFCFRRLQSLVMSIEIRVVLQGFITLIVTGLFCLCVSCYQYGTQMMLLCFHMEGWWLNVVALSNCVLLAFFKVCIFMTNTSR